MPQDPQSQPAQEPAQQAPQPQAPQAPSQAQPASPAPDPWADLQLKAAQLEEREQALKARESELRDAQVIHEGMRTDPAFQYAVQQAYIQRLNDAQGIHQDAGQGAQPQAAQPQADPRLVAALQQVMQQQQGVQEQVASIQEQQREALISQQVDQLLSHYPFARREELVPFLMDHPDVPPETAVRASSGHWEQEFAKYEQMVAEQRRANAQRSSLGPSGGVATGIDRSELESAQGRRDIMRRLAQQVSAVRRGG